MLHLYRGKIGTVKLFSNSLYKNDYRMNECTCHKGHVSFVRITIDPDASQIELHLPL